MPGITSIRIVSIKNILQGSDFRACQGSRSLVFKVPARDSIVYVYYLRTRDSLQTH